MKTARRTTPADRTRAVARLRSMTIGTTLAGLAAVGAFGSVAAISYSGHPTGGTADVETSSSGTGSSGSSGSTSSGSSTTTSATTTATATATPTPTIRLATTTATTTTGGGQVTTGGS